MSAFDYPTAPHTRKHGPSGYATYAAYRPWLRDEFTFRCVSRLRPPEGNSRLDGIENGYFARRQRGELPETY